MFADFVASFEDPRAVGKTFVRGNTINPETKGTFWNLLSAYQSLVAYLYLMKVFKPFVPQAAIKKATTP